MNGRLHLLIASALLACAAAPAQAYDAGDWIFRAGVGGVEPKSDNLDLSDGVDSVYVNVDSAMSLTLTGTYMLTPNWAIDVLAAYPFNHDINLEVNGESAKISETDHLPPTVSIQYHFIPNGDIQPYVGLGVNYTTFFNTDTVSELSDLGVDLELDNSFGVATQFGVDWMLGKNWLLNADLRWINIETDATLGGESIGTVEIDPWVYSINVGYRF